MTAKETIQQGKAILGIEFGSTRIKAVLVDQENNPIAQGSHEWENQLVDGLWTYSVEAIWYGLQDCYADLRKDVMAKYDCEIEILAAIGFSAMMHGYMAFNKQQDILVPFRTWRNTNTAKAAAELSELFVYNIPLRWSRPAAWRGCRRSAGWRGRPWRTAWCWRTSMRPERPIRWESSQRISRSFYRKRVWKPGIYPHLQRLKNLFWNTVSRVTC